MNLVWGAILGYLVEALSWAGTVSLGWVAADVYNENETTKQETGKSDYPATTGRVMKARWRKYVFIGVIIAVVFLVAKKFLKPLISSK